jgi:hypothetical protein
MFFKGMLIEGLIVVGHGKPYQARKKNSPKSGLLRFLVARGEIEPPTQGFLNIPR